MTNPVPPGTPDGTGSKHQQEDAERTSQWTKSAFGAGYGTWADLLAQDVAAVYAERDIRKLRTALAQVAAACAAWDANLDSRATVNVVTDPTKMQAAFRAAAEQTHRMGGVS